MEILTAIAGAVAEYTISPIIRQGGYIIHCKRNIQTLQYRVDDLKAARERVDVQILEAHRKGEHIYPDVTNWIAKVQDITAEADDLLKAENQAKIKCMLGCPNPVAHHKLSRKSKKLVAECNIEKEFSSISYGGRTEVVFLTPVKDYEEFDSRISTLNGIIDALKDPGINKIGIYGIGGVGKTTMAEAVVRQVKKDGLFDDVVIVRDVKEDPDIERLQQEIAEQLGMDYAKDLKDLSRDAKGRRIYDRLKNKKTFLVLDDIWNFFNLKVVGVPDLATSKVLFTSRIKQVLSSTMGTQKNFQLANLGENECWQLFKSKAGEVVEDVNHMRLSEDPKIRAIATEVAKRCGALPILVVTVASTLKESSLPEWEDVLRRLKKFEKKGLTEQAFLALQWSYDRLDDEELKPLFLLCGVIARKNTIILDDLFKLAMGLGLLKNIDTMDEARNSMLSLVIKLKGFSLLLDHDDDESVRMHDLVHDVANDIASRDGQLLSVTCEAEFKRWQQNSKCSKISTKSNSLAEIFDVLECQKLEMCYLRCEDRHRIQVPHSFTANMEKLKVLGLKYVMINLTSLGFLMNLRTLCLDDCKVEDIAVIGVLRKLEILLLGRSNIKHLPEEIGELNCLRLLDLTWCFSLSVIAPNVLSRLTRLEDLRMRKSFDNWEAEHEGERSKASLSELKHLSLLTALEIQVRNPDVLPKDLFSNQLERFYIQIGSDLGGRTSMNKLELRFTTGNELDENLKMLVKRSEDLALIGGPGVNETAYQLEADHFQQVKHLQLFQLDTTYFINSKVVFSSLLSLEVVDCHDIKFLLSSSMARSLVQLRTLDIMNCRRMVEIVSAQEDDEEDHMANAFSKLESLTLYGLPSLIRFYTGSHAEFSSLDDLLISNGQSHSTTVDSAVLDFVFDEKVKFPSLKDLELYGVPKVKAVWQNLNQLAPDSFCRLRQVLVRSCESLTNLFVPCITERLDALELLEVNSCPSLEVVFKCGGVKFENTQDASTKDLKTFSCFPNLLSLTVFNCDRLKYIFQEEESLETVPIFEFPKVTELRFYKLPHVKSIYPGNHVSQWPSLQELTVDDCGEVEILAGQLSASQERQESDSLTNPIKQPLISIQKGSSIFLNLESLTLGGMQIWSGPPPAQFCSKLKLVIAGDSTFSKHATFLERLQNLEKVVVDGDVDVSSRGEAIVVDGGDIHLVGIFPQVKNLKIRHIHHLMHIQKESAVPVFPKLERLGVRHCFLLKNLDTSAISFQNMTVLTAYRLDVLEYLVSHRIARSLMQLTQLKISYCSRMEVIVATDEEDDDAANHDITFSRLKHLELTGLPRLREFCLGSCNLKFPSLEALNISKLLKLKLFSHDEIRCTINYDSSSDDNDSSSDASAC